MATPREVLPTRGGDVRGSSSGCRIRPAQAPDLPAVAAMEKDVYSNPWHPDTFFSLLERDRVSVLVAETTQGQERIVGYAVVWWVLDQAELANLAVAQDYRGKGIGSDLLDEALRMAWTEGVRRMFLEVRWSNDSAFRLYTRRGFTQISVRRGYYQSPREDARVLTRPLGPPKKT